LALANKAVIPKRRHWDLFGGWQHPLCLHDARTSQGTELRIYWRNLSGVTQDNEDGLLRAHGECPNGCNLVVWNLLCLFGRL
jgi:hypothetical protein